MVDLYKRPSCHDGSQRSPAERSGPFSLLGGGWSASLREVSVELGRRKGEGKGWRNRRCWQVTKWCRCLPKTGSTSAHCRQVWSGLSRTWTMGKQTKPIIANTQTEVCVFVYARVWDSVFMQNTNASCLASMESFAILCNFKCITTSWTRKCSVQLSKIKSYLYRSCVIFFNHFWILCKWSLRLIIRESNFQININQSGGKSISHIPYS